MLWMPDFFLDRAKVVRKYPDGLLPASSVRSKVYQFPNSGRVYYPAGSTETKQCDMLPGKALTSPVTSTIGRCHIAFLDALASLESVIRVTEGSPIFS